MYKRWKVMLYGLSAAGWFLSTVLMLFYSLTQTEVTVLYNERQPWENVLFSNKTPSRNKSMAPLSFRRTGHGSFSYEKYYIGEVKKMRLSAMLEKIMQLHPRSNEDYYSFNVTRSDEIPVMRDVPDHRPGECRNRKFNYSSFPTVSVVTPFHNEALTSLVRHVHAILSRTPPFLLTDIILVDDDSTFEYLGRDLEEYFRILDPKIKIIRNKERKGLIVSRLQGADYARGEVIIFMDAHMEACEGWIEPLLERINSYPAIVVQPDICIIDGSTLNLYTGNTIGYRGGFGWDMRFSWLPFPDYLYQLARTAWEPVPFPVLQGSCIAVRKSYFNSIGRFDTGLEIWGGEHFELSFNVWMTGGRVEAIPCSKVGHIFKNNKYSFGSREKKYTVAKNDLRVAEVWMDEYKKIVQAAVQTWQDPLPVFSQEDRKSIDERRKMRFERKSESFNWFLKNVMPEQKVPEDTHMYFGEIMNLKTKQCLSVTDDGYIEAITGCETFVLIPENTFALDKYGRLKHATKCVLIDETTYLLKTKECPCITGKDSWSYWSVDRVHLVFSGQFGAFCATQANSQFPIHRGREMVQLQACDGSRQEQDWSFMYQLQHD